VKFLCDRCKTRYSIGDDRVRGKILKVRCKNCANVITVREGMEAPPEAAAPSRGRPTTNAPIADPKPGNGALNAAFSAQLQKPPPALEEEWYVSIDGEQSGPFSLPEAQRWVASKPFDADLHCWSEGFDDWLPVDKVSHFRGLRKKPAPAPAPPPMPRAMPRVAAAAPAAPAAPVDEEPKPLFAATMASLEKSASTTLPPVSSPAIKTNGSAAAPPIPAAARTTGKAPAIPSVQAKGSSGPMPSIPAKPAVPSATSPKGTGPVRAGTTQGVGSPGAQALAAAFDTEGSDGMTSVGEPPFDDNLQTMAEPVAAAKRALDAVAEPPRPDPFAAAAAAAPKQIGFDALEAEQKRSEVADDDNLDIGEVSRVVNLKDLARPPRKTAGNTGPVPRVTGQVGRVTGPVGRVTGPVNRVTASVAKLTAGEAGLPADPDAPPSDLAAGESVVVPAPVAQTHRRGLIMLIGVAAVLLLGVVGAVVLMVTSSDDDAPLGLGRTSQLNTDRPEDIGHPRSPGDVGPSGSGAGAQKIVRPHFPGFNPTQQQRPTQVEEPVDPSLKKLGPDEIEDMAAKQGEGTKFCYIRAQKGALGLEIQDLKKLSVTLTIDKTGTVTDVQLSEHAKDSFGSCLISRIKGWKFRASPGGTFRIALAFSAG
jgi:predicted Zn finger-like uncharacterized protein